MAEFNLYVYISDVVRYTKFILIMTLKIPSIVHLAKIL